MLLVFLYKRCHLQSVDDVFRLRNQQFETSWISTRHIVEEMRTHGITHTASSKPTPIVRSGTPPIGHITTGHSATPTANTDPVATNSIDSPMATVTGPTTLMSSPALIHKTNFNSPPYQVCSHFYGFHSNTVRQTC